MIRFHTNSMAFEKSLSQILDYEIDYLTPTQGILYFQEEQMGLLELFIAQMAQEQNIELTCLHCYGDDALTRTCLDFAQRQRPGTLQSLSTLLLIAIMLEDQSVLDAIKQWMSRLEPSLYEFAEMYIKQQGHAIHTAQRLYVHRNTILNRLIQFEKATLMDLREAENRECLKIMMTYMSTCA